MRSTPDKEYEGGALTVGEERSLILGYALLPLLEEAPDHALGKQVMAFLDTYLDEPNERALFNLGPIPSPWQRRTSCSRPDCTAES